MQTLDNIVARAYLGKRFHDLLTTLSDQLAVVYQANAITVPVAASSTLHYLSENDAASAADIAGSLDITHQLATQRIETLFKRGLVEKRPDPNDARRVCWRLTPNGRDQAQRLSACMHNAIDVHEVLFDEIGVDLLKALDDAQAALTAKPLSERFAALSDVELAS